MKNILIKLKKSWKLSTLISIIFIYAFVSFFNAGSYSDSPPAGYVRIDDGQSLNSEVYAKDGTVFKIVKQGSDVRDLMVAIVNDLRVSMPMVPELTSTGVQSMTQNYIEGFAYDQLSGTPKSTAYNNAVLAVDKACNEVGRALVGQPLAFNEAVGFKYTDTTNLFIRVDTNVNNFRFDSSGKITGWFDPIVITESSAGVSSGKSGAPDISPPLRQGPSVVSVSTVASIIAMKLGLAFQAGDYVLGLNSASDKTKYTLNYLLDLGAVTYGLYAGKVYISEIATAFLGRSLIGGIAAAVIAPWVGAGVVVALTAVSGYFFYQKLMANQPIASVGTDSNSAASGLQEANYAAIGAMASKQNGCLGSCDHNLYGQHSQLFVEGVSLNEFQDAKNITFDQAVKLNTLSQDYVTRLNTYLNKAQSSGLKSNVPIDLTMLQSVAKSIRRSQIKVASDASSGSLGSNLGPAYTGATDSLDWPSDLLVLGVSTLYLNSPFVVLNGQLKTGSGYWQDIYTGARGATLCDIFDQSEIDPCIGDPECDIEKDK